MRKTKDINFKVFNMITNKNEAKTMVKHISCCCKCKFNRTTFHSNQKWNNETCHRECKKYPQSKKKIIAGILAYVFVRMLMIEKLEVMKLYMLWILYQQI